MRSQKHYRSKKTAKRKLKVLRSLPSESSKKGPGDLNIYRCPHCGLWQIGNRTKGIKEKAEFAKKRTGTSRPEGWSERWR